MQIQKIGKRGVLFTFLDLKDEFDCTTNVYLINGNNYIFICDTFLGPDAMDNIKNYINSYLEKKPIIIFNSHSDWDHIWGNCAFASSMIIGHRLCRENIAENGERDLKKHSQFKRGNVKIILPNVSFEERICFSEDGVEFFHSPGHTEDSASCFDRIDHVLFVGDNVEAPYPYLQSSKLSDYILTLSAYLNLEADIIIPGHGDITSDDLIKSNLEYIKKEKVIKNIK